MAELSLYVYVIGLGSPFPVDIERSKTVGHLKEAILQKRPNALKGIDAAELVLYKAALVYDAKDFEGLLPQALKVELEDPLSELSEIFPEKPRAKVISILVGVPGINRSKSDVGMQSTRPHQIEFTMKLLHILNWDHLGEDDLSCNNIRRALSSPRLLEFQERLRRKRYIGDATQDVYARLLGPWIPSTSSDTYFESVIPAETNPSELDCVTKNELTHYASIFGGSELRERAYFDQDKESQVRALLLAFVHRLRSVRYNSWGFDSQFPFHLVVETPDENLSYSPRSDFHVCIKDFPHFLLEVVSQTNESDRFRMLLQASCIARIGNWLRASTSGEPIVIMAIYIDKHFEATQYLLYQPDVGSTEVEYDATNFDLTAPQAAFEFIFQLYNFLSAAQTDNNSFHEPARRLADAKASVAQRNYSAITKRRKLEGTGTKRDSKRPRVPPAGGGAGDSFDNSSVQRDLARVGYTLTQPISKDLTLLTPLKPAMRQATSRTGAFVVLKTIADTNERQLLQYLRDIKEQSNHTIPLLDVIDLSVGKTIIALPWKSPLDEVLQLRGRPDNVVSLCLQFIEGVAFLHQHKVAHCDLKPGNVVVDTISESETLPRLFIIDFDLAQSVESEETIAQGWCGTPPWIAPELGSRDGPIQRYSPILADRWACGRMVKHFAKYFPTYEGARKTKLLAVAQRLLNLNPSARPKLNELQAIRGPTKRKSVTSQHEPLSKRHAAQELQSFNSSIKFPEAQVVIPALEKAEMRLSMTGGTTA